MNLVILGGRGRVTMTTYWWGGGGGGDEAGPFPSHATPGSSVDVSAMSEMLHPSLLWFAGSGGTGRSGLISSGSEKTLPFGRVAGIDRWTMGFG